MGYFGDLDLKYMAVVRTEHRNVSQHSERHKRLVI